VLSGRVVPESGRQLTLQELAVSAAIELKAQLTPKREGALISTPLVVMRRK
jgi:hypothetical protein